MLETIVTLIAAYALCFFFCALAKKYTDKYCKDNPETVWIWLDDEEIPAGGKPAGADPRVLLRPAPQF